MVTDVANLPVSLVVKNRRVPLGTKGSTGAIPNPAVSDINLNWIYKPLQTVSRRTAGETRVNNWSVGSRGSVGVAMESVNGVGFVPVVAVAFAC